VWGIVFFIFSIVFLGISTWGWIHFFILARMRRPSNTAEFLGMSMMGTGLVVIHWMPLLGLLLLIVGLITSFVLYGIFQSVAKKRFGMSDEEVEEFIKEKKKQWIGTDSENKGEAKLPEWYLLLCPECRPTGERISKLEALRTKYEIPADIFSNAIMGYPAVAKLLQINLYKQAKKKWPKLSNNHILRNILLARAIPPKPYGYGMTEEEFEKVMGKINSLETLCDYVETRELKESVIGFDLSAWEKNIEMLEKADTGKEVDWERHKRNWERIKRDNVKEKVNAIIEEEVQEILAQIKHC